MTPARRLPTSGARASSRSASPDHPAHGTRPGDGLRLLADADPARPAVVDAASGATWTYARLRDEVRRVSRLLADAVGSLVLVHARNDVATLVSVLACLDAGATALPVDADLAPDALAGLLVRYRPALVLGGRDDPEGYAPAPRDRTVGAVAGRSSFDAVACHPDLGLLAVGGDGPAGPRLVRLSVDAVLAAATAMGTALAPTADDVLALALPLHDTGGLAIVGAHLLAGASVVLHAVPAASAVFRETVVAAASTTLAVGGRDLASAATLVSGDAAVPSLREVVAVGAGLDTDEVRALSFVVDRSGRRLQAVHGRPEEGGCATVLGHEQARTRGASFGRAVPGGRVEVLIGGDRLVVVAEHVMMGYAIGGADLVKGDELCGRFITGDRGTVDGDGYVWPADATARSTA